MEHSDTPLARHRDLVIQEVADEILVYGFGPKPSIVSTPRGHLLGNRVMVKIRPAKSPVNSRKTSRIALPKISFGWLLTG